MPDTRAIPLSLETIEFRDPDADFEQAAKHGELHFVAINELTTILPGLSDDCPRDLVAEFGSKTIEGTSDGPASRAESDLNAIARMYAERYNRLILVHLQKHQDERVRRLTRRCS